MIIVYGFIAIVVVAVTVFGIQYVSYYFKAHDDK